MVMPLREDSEEPLSDDEGKASAPVPPEFRMKDVLAKFELAQARRRRSSGPSSNPSTRR